MSIILTMIRFVLMLAVSFLPSCIASNSAFMETSFEDAISHLPGEYVRQNLDIEERLQLFEDSSYKWTQLVLQEDGPIGYSHKGIWKLKDNEILLVPETSLPESFKEGLRYMLLNLDGKVALVQKASSRYIDSSQLNRFVYLPVQVR